jgi:hypothetical protein
MKWILSAISLLLFCGCTHIETPHHVGDKLELIRDVYVVEHVGKSLPDITVNIKSKNKGIWEGFPVEVSEENIGECIGRNKIVGVLKAGTVLEVLKFDLEDRVGDINNPILMKNIPAGAVYDLSNNGLVDFIATRNKVECALTPLVFKPIPKLGDGKER